MKAALATVAALALAASTAFAASDAALRQKIEARFARAGLDKRADITVSEKYRRIIEAYQIETEYGRNLPHVRENPRHR